MFFLFFFFSQLLPLYPALRNRSTYALIHCLTPHPHPPPHVLLPILKIDEGMVDSDSPDNNGALENEENRDRTDNVAAALCPPPIYPSTEVIDLIFDESDEGNNTSNANTGGLSSGDEVILNPTEIASPNRKNEPNNTKAGLKTTGLEHCNSGHQVAKQPIVSFSADCKSALSSKRAEQKSDVTVGSLIVEEKSTTRTCRPLKIRKCKKKTESLLMSFDIMQEQVQRVSKMMTFFQTQLQDHRELLREEIMNNIESEGMANDDDGGGGGGGGGNGSHANEKRRRSKRRR